MFKNSNCDRKFSGINVKFVSYIVKSAHVQYKAYQGSKPLKYAHIPTNGEILWLRRKDKQYFWLNMKWGAL